MDRKHTICQVPLPDTKQSWRIFLGMVGFCKIWIPNFSILACPLYKVLKRPGDRMDNTPGMEKAFTLIKEKVLSASALGLPDPEWPFELLVHERHGMALGVLTQRIGSWRRPVAYLSKLLDIEGMQILFGSAGDNTCAPCGDNSAGAKVEGSGFRMLT